MRWPAAAAPTRKTRASADRSPVRRRCRPRRSSAAPTASAPGRAAERKRPRCPKASRSKAAIAAWAIIRPWSTRSPIVWRRPKANGRRSIALAGVAWSIRIRTGKPAASALPFQAKAATKSRALRAPDAAWGMRERVDRRRRSAPRRDRDIVRAWNEVIKHRQGRRLYACGNLPMLARALLSS